MEIAQEIQLSNGEIFKIVDSSVPITCELIMSVANTLEASKKCEDFSMDTSFRK